MGSEIQIDDDPQVTFSVEGTNAIERVELLRGTEVVHMWQVARFDSDDADIDDDGILLRVLWGGTERKGTARLQRVQWDGSLSVANGELELVEAINVQSFADHVESVGKERVEWTNATAGNATGIVVRVRGDQATVLSFHSEHTQFDVKLSDVRGKEHTVDAGGVDRFVKIGPAPRTDGRRQFDASWIDTTSLPGVVPYWLRVTQVDQAMAWSSPVYVSHAGQM